jgi:tetratricopeptide (TPR) repeat protein
MSIIDSDSREAAGTGKHMASDKFNAMLRSLRTRIAGEPAYQPILQQLDILLDSRQPFLPAAWVAGTSLSDAGLLDEAQELYKGLAENFPDKPVGFAGMAQLAMQRRAWREALACWNEVIARFSDSLAASWLSGRATALLELGRVDEAEIAFRVLTRDFSEEPLGFVGLARVAMSRLLWSDALVLWDGVLARFDNQAKPYWQAARANALSQLDRLDEAEDIFHRLVDDFPTLPPGFVGLAEIATRRGSWHEALASWNNTIARFSRLESPYWQVARAQVLLGLGRADEAEAVFRDVIGQTPESLLALTWLLRALIVKGKPEEASHELEASPFGSAEVPAVIERRFEILIALKRFGDARAEFERLLQTSTDPAVLNSLFTYTAFLHTGWRRTEIWITLLRKLEALPSLSDSKSPASPGLRARILLALRDYDRFLGLVSATRERDLGEHWRGLMALASKLRGPSFPDYRAPKIFGVGLSKTGTTSLAAALTTLGFHTLDWMNLLTGELMCEDDLHLFDAFTDAPVCANFEKYYFMFPNSKFIFTTRSRGSWELSMRSHYSRFYGHSNFEDLKVAMAQSETLHFGADFSNIYLSLYFNHLSYEEAYNLYDQRVRRFFQDKPKDRFLEFDVSACRWEELCAFTGRVKPSSPFPWLNRKP